MRRLTALYLALDRTTRTSEKVSALQAYFQEARPADAAWAVALLSGRKLVRAVPSARLRQWVAERSGYPRWLIEESYAAVGDLSETLSLLLPPLVHEPDPPPLAELIEQHILPLPLMSENQQRRSLLATWDRLDTEQRFLFHKLISANFRVGVARKLLVRGLAETAGLDPAVIDHRLSGHWTPSAQSFQALLDPGGVDDEPARPYPFFLASPWEDELAALGNLAEYQAEWKWDGIRAQLIRRQGRCLLWSRGEEMLAAAFPELVLAAQSLPDGTVLDGEILAFEQEAPLPFAHLQRRLNRKSYAPMLFDEVPVVFMAYDLLEADGQDQRGEPLHRRGAGLKRVMEALDQQAPLRLSPVVSVQSPEEIQRQLDHARQLGVEGLMLKRLDAPYRTGRVRGEWWKLKVTPYSVDCVMVYAQQGTGKRSNLFSDYTFAVWDDAGKLVPFTKAYSGLSDQEMRQVDRWVRQHTLQRHGPVRVVEPTQVFEIAFEGIQASDRHKAGIALRFPRMARMRPDKPPEEADRLHDLHDLLHRHETRGATLADGEKQSPPP